MKKIWRDLRVAKYGRRSRVYRRKNREMPFGELTTIVGDVVEQKYHGGGVSMSSYLNRERRGKTHINELIAIGEVSNPGSHGDQASLMWVMRHKRHTGEEVLVEKVSGESIPHQLCLLALQR